MNYKVGDVVMLKSGGPKMTIYWLETPTQIWCTWFEGTEKKEAHFHPDTLILAGS